MSILSGIFGMTDEQAMWRVQMHDDTEAFAHLLTRWQEPIRRLCTRMLADTHKAEDLTQEAFARVYSRRKDYQHGGKFSTFLWRVAINLCLDEIRRVKRRRELAIFSSQTEDSADGSFTETLPGNEPSPDSSLISEEQAEMVRRAVQDLPEHYRSVVILRHYQDLKFREIADVLQIPEGTVKSRMFEALTILNHALTHTKKEPRQGLRQQPRSNPREALVL
jgi:RNA polymerase sigma-70 factor (ECF subfamily)